MIYFDNAASTPMDEEAYNLLCLDLKNDFANPAAKHKLGVNLSKKIDRARNELLDLFKLANFNAIFTSSATESNNTIIKNFENKSIIYFSCDHPSITNVCHSKGLNFDQCITDFLNEETQLVVLTALNPQSGHIINLLQIVKEIRVFNSKIKIHLDAAQAAFKTEVDYNLVDSFTIAAHKIGGPKGISALIFKNDFNLRPLLEGGGHELALRSSTPSSPLIMSFIEACKRADLNFEKNFQTAQEVKRIVMEGLKESHKNISFPFENKSFKTSAYILCVKFIGIPSDIILRHLEMKDVYISSTTACSSKISGYNPMLDALGIEEKFHKNILRISFGFSSTKDEAFEFVKIFKGMVNEIKFLIK